MLGASATKTSDVLKTHSSCASLPFSPAPLVLITGASGVGKSAPALSLRPVVLRDRALFAQGEFHDYERDGTGSAMTAYGDVLEDLTQQLAAMNDSEKENLHRDINGQVGSGVQLVAGMVPWIGDMLNADSERKVPSPLRTKSEMTPGASSSKRLEYAYHCFLKAAARTRPLVILLDDVQWARPEAVASLEALMSSVEVNAKVLFIVTARPDVQSPGLQRLEEALLQVATCPTLGPCTAY